MVPAVKRIIRQVVVAPDELAGREVVVVEAPICGHRFNEWNLCGLVRNHRGECWECSAELVEQAGGAFALLVKADES